MELSIFLAKVLGWYFLIFGVYLFTRQETMKTVLAELTVNKALVLFMAIFTLVLGLLLVISHNVWVMGWPVVVTIIAWLVLITGLIRLFAPELAFRFAKEWLKNSHYILITAIINIIIGLFLLFKAYF